MYERKCLQNLKRVLDPRRLGFQVVRKHLLQVLGTELASPEEGRCSELWGDLSSPRSKLLTCLIPRTHSKSFINL